VASLLTWRAYSGHEPELSEVKLSDLHQSWRFWWHFLLSALIGAVIIAVLADVLNVLTGIAVTVFILVGVGLAYLLGWPRLSRYLARYFRR
jgi:hypothetical protein